MLQPKKLRELDLDAPPQAGRAAHLSAASGLVRAGSYLYVIADDEHHLGVFESHSQAPGRLIRLIEGELPHDAAERKALKPDFETLVRLPAFGSYSDGALFAMGSGSKPNRQTGALLALDAAGAILGAPRLIDLNALFAPVREPLRKLNVEGAVVAGDRLLLLQRGNKKKSQNACIEYSLPALLKELASSDALGKILPLAIRQFDLGAIKGVPLCFSDAAVLPNNELIFTAIAENTEDSYNDGPCLGSAIGIIGREGQMEKLWSLEFPHKIEGIEAQVSNGKIDLLLVTDADDANIPASLLSVEIGS